MIIGSEISLEVGKIYDDSNTSDMALGDHSANYHESFKFMVLREATEQEHIEYIRNNCPPFVIRIPRDYYYLISID